MIKRLDALLIQKIAAGEVIESPYSVVKELIENSMDANSTIIEIILVNAGKNLIVIKDNGHGMTKEDLKICFERHATSKITTQDDLYNIATLGFRGEALSSISAVSRLTIMSKQNDDNIGTFINVTEEKLISQNQTNMNQGTIILVKDLFYNLPVRLNFMRNKSYELRRIIELVKSYAIINKTIHFKLIDLENNNINKTLKENDFINYNDIKYSPKDIVVDSPSNRTLRDKVGTIFGFNVAKELIELNQDSKSIIIIDGLISKPSLYRSTRSNIYVYVNNRLIQNKTINNAIMNAYQAILSDKFPFVVINLIVPKSFVDVNVHPTKLMVKFSDDSEIYSSVYKIIKKTLESNSLIPSLSLKNNEQSNISSYAKSNVLPRSYSSGPMKSYSPSTFKTQNSLSEVGNIPYTNNDFDQPMQDDFIIMGQFANSYIIIQKDNKLLLLDQHVIEERINYEKFTEQFSNKAVSKQTLLSPLTIPVQTEDIIFVKDNLDTFHDLGIDLEVLDNSTLILRSLPFVLKEQTDSSIIFDLLAHLKQNKAQSAVSSIKDDMIKQMACKASIKQGEPLSLPYMKNIINSLFTTKNPYVCPHGRPVIVELSLDELNKMFKR